MAKPRSKNQRESDREAIAKLALQGWTQPAIARYLEINQSTVCRDLEAIRQQWRESALQDFDQLRGQQLSELELVKAELWAAWEQSKQDQQTSVKEQVNSPDSGSQGKAIARIKASVRTVTKPGDVAYLSGVLASVKEINKLLGLYPEESKPETTEAETTLKGYLQYLEAQNGKQLKPANPD